MLAVLVEGASKAACPVRQSLMQRLESLWKKMPDWAKYSSGASSVKAGFGHLHVSHLLLLITG